MSVLATVNPVFIILPIVFAQYIYATFALVCLARARLSALSYALWNVFIVLVFFVGSTAFLVYNAKRKKREADKSSDKKADGENRESPPRQGDKWDV